MEERIQAQLPKLPLPSCPAWTSLFTLKASHISWSICVSQEYNQTIPGMAMWIHFVISPPDIRCYILIYPDIQHSSKFYSIQGPWYIFPKMSTDIAKHSHDKSHLGIPDWAPHSLKPKMHGFITLLQLSLLPLIHIIISITTISITTITITTITITTIISTTYRLQYWQGWRRRC